MFGHVGRVTPTGHLSLLSPSAVREMRRGGACAPSSASAMPEEERALARPLMSPEPSRGYGTASACSPDTSKRPLRFVYVAFCFPALAGAMLALDPDAEAHPPGG